MQAEPNQAGYLMKIDLKWRDKLTLWPEIKNCDYYAPNNQRL